MCKSLYEGVEVNVLLGEGGSRWFEMKAELRQGCPFSPVLYGICVMNLEGERFGIEVEGTWYGELIYADDILLLPRVRWSYK